MKRLNIICMLSAMLVAFAGCSPSDSQSNAAPSSFMSPSDTERIVSLAPSITEVLFKLGLGNQVIAVTEYCVEPEAAKELPKVGAWNNASAEQLVALKPTCICLGVNHPLRSKLEQLGMPLLPVPGSTLDDVISSFELIGKRFSRLERGTEMASELNRRLEALAQQAQKREKPLRVLLVAYRSRGGGSVRNVSVAADDAYFQKLVKLAGGMTVPSGVGIAYPELSAEGILVAAPDVIVEIAPEMTMPKEEAERLIFQDWKNTLPMLPAVAAGNIIVFTENYATVPGPRTVVFVEELARRLGRIGALQD